ncbi:MAG TPA: hypothetical protein VFX29_03885 [Longimicrobiaceae bacterium]|nr:hypothetical protein [Longimicrobiaceae bacterium]
MPSDSVMMIGTFIPIVAILMGGLILLVPIAGLTLRFALKPALESLGHLRDLRTHTEALRLAEQRIALLEEQMHALSSGRAIAGMLPAGRDDAVAIGRIAPPADEAEPA